MLMTGPYAVESPKVEDSLSLLKTSSLNGFSHQNCQIRAHYENHPYTVCDLVLLSPGYFIYGCSFAFLTS
jgi:hypothetical protein